MRMFFKCYCSKDDLNDLNAFWNTDKLNEIAHLTEYEFK